MVAIKLSPRLVFGTADPKGSVMLTSQALRYLYDVGPKAESTVTYDPPNLADGAGTTTTVACNGAVLGQFALASFSADLQGITVSAWVSTADVVSVRFQNESGGALNLAEGTLSVRVL